LFASSQAASRLLLRHGHLTLPHSAGGVDLDEIGAGLLLFADVGPDLIGSTGLFTLPCQRLDGAQDPRARKQALRDSPTISCAPGGTAVDPRMKDRDVVVATNQFVSDMRADESRSADNQDAHAQIPGGIVTSSGAGFIGPSASPSGPSGGRTWRAHFEFTRKNIN
jgi:hypothetical protein